MPVIVSPKNLNIFILVMCRALTLERSICSAVIPLNLFDKGGELWNLVIAGKKAGEPLSRVLQRE